jgi:hypothetical protein
VNGINGMGRPRWQVVGVSKIMKAFLQKVQQPMELGTAELASAANEMSIRKRNTIALPV